MKLHSSLSKKAKGTKVGFMIDLRLIDNLKSNDLKKSQTSEEKAFDESYFSALYSIAYSFYQSGKFSDATTTFSILASLSPFEKKHWIGLGAAKHLQKDYKGALKAYSAAANIDDTDPVPHLHAAECYLALGDKSEALKVLEISEERALCGEGEDSKILDRIIVMKSTWINTIEERIKV
jgi:type III secretion system low calcium response chaperone LcrH/SycD